MFTTNIPCHMHGICLIDVKMTNNFHGTKKYKYKTCQGVKTGVHKTHVNQKTQHQKLNSYWVTNSLGDRPVHQQCHPTQWLR